MGLLWLNPLFVEMNFGQQLMTQGLGDLAARVSVNLGLILA